MSSPIDQLQRVMLAHAPRRYGVMLPPGGDQKYDDRRGTITPAMLDRHLAGEITLAAPAAANDLAAVLPLDIDTGGLAAIYALLDAAQARGLTAWAEYHHREEWPLEEQRGYVWAAFERLVPAEQLQQLGAELIQAADLPDDVRQRIEARTHQAITRLPFARHTHTGRFGALLLDYGRTWIETDPDPRAACERWANTDHLNSVALLPEVAPLPPQPQAPSTHTHANKYSVNDIKAAYNQAVDVGQLLLDAGARRASRTLLHCPCGHHSNGDRQASLLIKPARRKGYGCHIAEGLAPHCRFAASPRQVWDSFNVYMQLHSLTFVEMLAHARQFLGLHDAPDGPRAPKAAGKGATTTTSQQTAQRATPHPSAENPVTARALREAATLRLAQDAGLSPAARKTQAYLIGQAEGHNASWCKRTIPHIAQAIRHAPRTVRSAIRQLEARGHLTTTYSHNQWGGDQASIYQLGATPQDAPIRADLFRENSHEAGRPKSSPLPAQIAAPPPSSPGGGGAICSPMLNRLDRGGRPAPQRPPVPAHQAEADASAGRQPAAPATGHPVLEIQDQIESALTVESGATFEPVDTSGWPEPRPWARSMAPKEYYWRFHALDELEELRHVWFAPREQPAPPAAPAVEQEQIQFDQAEALTADQAEAAWRPAGMQALRAELERIEREARRHFARKATVAGQQARGRARRLREELGRLEQTLSAPSASTASDRSAPRLVAPPIKPAQPRDYEALQMRL